MQITFVQVLDFIGTLAFAVSGIRLSSAKRFDLFGAYIVGLVTAIGGGTMRDLMLGVPIFWMHDPFYLICTALALLWVILFSRHLIHQNNTWFIFDTIGLAMFTVTGIEKTMHAPDQYPFWAAIIMGTITGAAGGVFRDVFMNQVPLIFRGEIYALACVLGGIAYFAALELGLSTVAAGLICGAFVITMRILAVRYRLHLPILKGDETPKD
ncbi:MAG: trimeric intracellular cation channel family protein [Bacteroidaceae bacterium]|nr:trimeric intracellular cation channel family protein [Bacteroidaceae bacterium]